MDQSTQNSELAKNVQKKNPIDSTIVIKKIVAEKMIKYFPWYINSRQ